MAFKFKLNLKDFDFKQFFLQRGEWIGLGVVLLIVIPILAIGIKNSVSAGRPESKKKDIEKLALNLEERIRTSQVPADASTPPPEFLKEVTFGSVDPAPYRTETAMNVPSGIEDTRRRKPEVLAPDRQFVMQPIFNAIPGAIINPGAEGQMLVEVLQKEDADPRQKIINARLRALG